MSTLREAAQQALAAMLNFPDDISDEMFAAITAIKSALAQQAELTGKQSLQVDHGLSMKTHTAALRLLEALADAMPYGPLCGEFDRVADAADDLRKALAQLAAPIGYMPRDQYDFLLRGTHGVNTRIEALPQDPFVVPIYAAPQ